MSNFTSVMDTFIFATQPQSAFSWYLNFPKRNRSVCFTCIRTGHVIHTWPFGALLSLGHSDGLRHEYMAQSEALRLPLWSLRNRRSPSQHLNLGGCMPGVSGSNLVTMRNPRDSVWLANDIIGLWLQYWLLKSVFIWTSLVCDPIKAFISWASLSRLKCPTQRNISSTRTTSHSISINTFTSFLASGLNPCLCPSCQATWKLNEDSGDSFPGQMSPFIEEMRANHQCPEEHSQASCLILSLSFYLLIQRNIALLPSNMFGGYQSAPGACFLLYNMKEMDQAISKSPL